MSRLKLANLHSTFQDIVIVTVGRESCEDLPSFKTSFIGNNGIRALYYNYHHHRYVSSCIWV